MRILCLVPLSSFILHSPSVSPSHHKCLSQLFFIRQTSRFEDLSRVVRNYVPSSISIAIPSAAPSPPRVSRPVSFGSFMTASSGRESGARSKHARSFDQHNAGHDEALAFHDEEEPIIQVSGQVRYPGTVDTENILWATWDCLPPSPRSSKAK